MPIHLTPALREAMEDCEQAAQRVTQLEAGMRKINPADRTASMKQDYDNAFREWRNAQGRWERLYLAAGGRL